jgi:hypothetical protein
VYVGFSIEHPISPRTDIHDRLDIEHADVGIVGKTFMHLAHRIRIRLIIDAPIRGRYRLRLLNERAASAWLKPNEVLLYCFDEIGRRMRGILLMLAPVAAVRR